MLSCDAVGGGGAERDAVGGGGAERERWRPAAPLLWLSIFHSETHNQTGPLWCWFLSGLACAHSRPLWVSPMTSPTRLGVSPAAAPTPMGVFNQRFEALFPQAGALVCAVCFARPRSSGYLCVNVGPQGATHRSACPVLRHSVSGPLGLSAGMWGLRVCSCPVCPTLRQSRSRHGHASPLHPGAHLHPSYRFG